MEYVYYEHKMQTYPGAKELPKDTVFQFQQSHLQENIKSENAMELAEVHSNRDEVEIQRPSHELCSFSKLCVTSPTSQLILQPFRRFTYVTAHSSTLPLLHLSHSTFSIPFFASPTS